jgi:hypothetical protein
LQTSSCSATIQSKVHIIHKDIAAFQHKEDLKLHLSAKLQSQARDLHEGMYVAKQGTIQRACAKENGYTMQMMFWYLRTSIKTVVEKEIEGRS